MSRRIVLWSFNCILVNYFESVVLLIPVIGFVVAVVIVVFFIKCVFFFNVQVKKTWLVKKSFPIRQPEKKNLDKSVFYVSFHFGQNVHLISPRSVTFFHLTVYRKLSFNYPGSKS